MHAAWSFKASRLADALRGRPSRREQYRSLIAAHAPGRRFAEVGCMWQVHGEYAFHAATVGAREVIGIDVMTPTPEFTARNATAAHPIRYEQADVNDPALVDRIGEIDVLFCAGVLYHMPNPLSTLERLRRLCRETLILASVTIAEQAVPQAAVFLPFLSAAAVRRLGFSPEGLKVGIDTPFDRERTYTNWFWGLTPSALGAMLGAAGFAVVERYDYRRAVCFVCRAV